MSKNCLNLNCGNTVSDRAKYCSDACRMAVKRAINKHDSTMNPNIEPEQTKPEQSKRTPEHQRLFEILESWWKGEGTEYQRRLGTLSMFYGSINGCIGYPKPSECGMIGEPNYNYAEA